MLSRVRAERPQVRQVRTDNALSNAPMLAINDALGFTVVAARTDGQPHVEEVSQRCRT